MAAICIDNTNFSFEIIPPKFLSSGYYLSANICVENEQITYRTTLSDIVRDDFENWLNGMSRLLAGAYTSDYNVHFERTGFSVDLCPYTLAGQEVEREVRRQNECHMAISLALKSADQTKYLGGIYTLIFNRKQIATFVHALREEYERIFARFLKGKGKYAFVGVSPLGYDGCNYWYFDPSQKVEKGDYVWVRMGRHNTKQIVLVDSVRRFSDDTAPYDPDIVKQVLRKATQEEIEQLK